MKYIPIAKLLKINQVTNPIGEFQDSSLRVKQSQLTKILNDAKAEQRIADMRVIEVKIDRLEKENATAEKILNEFKFYAAERKAIANAIKKQI